MTILEKLMALEQEADHFGFRWNNPEQILAQIRSECAEISAELKAPLDVMTTKKCQEEIGDLLHAVFSLCIFCQFDPVETLEKSVTKFERRLKGVKKLAQEQGLSTLKEKSFQELMLLWDNVKKRE